MDGLVLARSSRHHSANYRSVSVFGQCRCGVLNLNLLLAIAMRVFIDPVLISRLVEDDTKKLHALRIITNHIMGTIFVLRGAINRVLEVIVTCLI